MLQIINKRVSLFCAVLTCMADVEANRASLSLSKALPCPANSESSETKPLIPSTYIVWEAKQQVSITRAGMAKLNSSKT